ncbi:hypothetical protein F4781DRAFT_400086 [Annulohypoxylon bovei var. microspora]|nr:hypothetical protein F4781DRAFT_400086 [Annulohypoxylon bovei var. microspora]
MPGIVTIIAYTRAALVLIALSLLITREARVLWGPPTSSPAVMISKPEGVASHDATCYNREAVGQQSNYQLPSLYCRLDGADDGSFLPFLGDSSI